MLVAAIILRISVLKAGALKVSNLMRWIWSVRAELEGLHSEVKIKVSSRVSAKDHLVVHSRVNKADKASEAAHSPAALSS